MSNQNIKITVENEDTGEKNVFHCDRYILSLFSEKNVGPLKFDKGNSVIIPALPYADRPEQILRDILNSCGKLDKNFDQAVKLIKEHEHGNKDNG